MVAFKLADEDLPSIWRILKPSVVQAVPRRARASGVSESAGGIRRYRRPGARGWTRRRDSFPRRIF